MRVTTVLCLTIMSLASCMVGESAPKRGDEAPSLVLAGNDLDRELAASPAHNTTITFRRVGIMFDSDRPGSIEVSTSRDNATWSEWRAIDLRHVEVENHSAFVGEVAVEGGLASYFRLRGSPGHATYARIDVLGSVGEEWEGGDAETVDQAALAPAASLQGVTVHSRASWGARPANCTASLTPKKLTIHESDTPNNDTISAAARVRQIQSYHRDVRGWCDIGYHFLISSDGEIYEGRPITRLGAHTAGANTDNVGIALIGSFNQVAPSSAQLAATSALLRAIATQYGITLSRTTVKGHREQGTTETDCPGEKTFALLPSIVEAAKRGDVPPPPPMTLDTIQGVVYAGSDPTARIAGATVTIAGKSAITDASGSYTITGIAPGVYDVRVEKSGFTASTISRDTTTDTWISVSLNKLASGGTAVLQGVIYRGSNGLDRIPDAKVTLSTGQITYADAHGYYLVTGLPPGPVTITAAAKGYAIGTTNRTLANGVTEWGSVSLK